MCDDRSDPGPWGIGLAGARHRQDEGLNGLAFLHLGNGFAGAVVQGARRHQRVVGAGVVLDRPGDRGADDLVARRRRVHPDADRPVGGGRGVDLGRQDVRITCGANLKFAEALLPGLEEVGSVIVGHL